jgi:hypothetical protein
MELHNRYDKYTAYYGFQRGCGKCSWIAFTSPFHLVSPHTCPLYHLIASQSALSTVTAFESTSSVVSSGMACPDKTCSTRALALLSLFFFVMQNCYIAFSYLMYLSIYFKDTFTYRFVTVAGRNGS